MSLHQLTATQSVLAGRYRIVREIGSGGAATVFLAEDQKHARDVAVKVLRPELASALGGAFFLREIGIAAHLQHPHVVPLYDSGESDGLLYYVMPFVDGESLRARLSRDTRLDEAEAVRISREVALGLDYAHRRGVVHRDIKPDNVLLSSGQAMVADFGIARAITVVGGQRLTGAGIFVGTPAYMSPEQATGAEEVDARSDLYSLGCVLFEMLTGRAPFVGTSAQQVLARHAAEAAPSVRSLRPDVDDALDACVARALAKNPADRWATASEFGAALAAVITPVRYDAWHGRPETSASPDVPVTVVAPTDPEEEGSERGPAWYRSRTARVIGAAVVLLAALGGVAWSTGARTGIGAWVSRAIGPDVPLDTTRVALLPFEYDPPTLARPNDTQRLEDALERWKGVTVVDPFQIREALERVGSSPLRAGDARRVAELVAAGRYIRANVTRIEGTIRVHASLYDTRSNAVLSDSVIRVDSTMTGSQDRSFAALADRLLFREEGSDALVAFEAGTNMFAARQALGRGLSAVERWDLPSAKSAFKTALTADPEYAQAALWLAQASWWNMEPAETWRFAAERASLHRERLPDRERGLATAFVAVADGKLDDACSRLRELTTSKQSDFAAWYSLATCLYDDSIVVADTRTKSGWRFRTSYQEAVTAYQNAYRLLPSIHSALRGSAYSLVRRLFLTNRNDLRPGYTPPPESRRFLAYPAWAGDSLVLVPYPDREFFQAREQPIPESLDEAVRRQRLQFHQIASAWMTAYPNSADALEAIAVSLEMRGDPSCLDSLRRARTLARSPEEMLRVGASLVWMQIKFSVPQDSAGIRTARLLADSLLRAFPPGNAPNADALASLAALTGRATLAAQYGRDPSGVVARDIPASLTDLASPFLAYAALGGPRDSLLALESRMAAALDGVESSDERTALRMEWLARPATLAFADVHLTSLKALAGMGDYLVDAEVAWTRRDTSAIDSILAGVRLVRRSLRASDLTFDTLLPEAWLLMAIGKDQPAATWLDPTLGAFRFMAPQVLATPDRAGPFVRAAALRAILAHRLGDDRTARRWAGVVDILWSDPDPFLVPLRDSVRALAR